MSVPPNSQCLQSQELHTPAFCLHWFSRGQSSDLSLGPVYHRLGCGTEAEGKRGWVGGGEISLFFGGHLQQGLPATVSGPWVRAHESETTWYKDSRGTSRADRVRDSITVYLYCGIQPQIWEKNLERTAFITGLISKKIPPVIWKVNMALVMNNWMCLLALSFAATSGHPLRR